jgi:hypothetical protein
MIERLEQSTGNTLGYKVSGTVDKGDYEVLTQGVQALVHEMGDINVLLDVTEFHWEKVSAWGADLKFGHDYHNKITKMAIVGDKKWQKWASHLAAPFYAREAQYFDAEVVESAWEWVMKA